MPRWERSPEAQDSAGLAVTRAWSFGIPGGRLAKAAVLSSAWGMLPLVTNHDGRSRLEKYRGSCSLCGAGLKFYARPIRWHSQHDEGGVQRVVDERAPAAECRQDPNHWWDLRVSALRARAESEK